MGLVTGKENFVTYKMLAHDKHQAEQLLQKNEMKYARHHAGEGRYTFLFDVKPFSDKLALFTEKFEDVAECNVIPDEFKAQLLTDKEIRYSSGGYGDR